MQTFFIVLVFCCLASFIASADQSSHTILNKSDHHVMIKPAFDGREGGETILDAFLIEALPFNDTGATCDNLDDYEVPCPYGGGIAPDVVYQWHSTFSGTIYIDLCGSLYDTKVFVFDSQFNEIACNDDYYIYPSPCGEYVSYIGDCPVSSGEVYYIVVDGYVNDCGSYSLEIDEVSSCELLCSADAQLEGEPPLEDGYVDLWNGGCDSVTPEFQIISNSLFCGVAGWYSLGGGTHSDTDWFEVRASGFEILWEVIAESRTTCCAVVMGDCDNFIVSQWMHTHSCQAMEMSVPTQPGETVFLYMKSFFNNNPGGISGNEYDYICVFSGVDTIVSTEDISWDGVKALFR